MQYFPNNTTTSFSTRLPREIELHDKWQVGLAEIHIPCTMLHLRYSDTVISADDANSEVHFQHGVYNSIQSLIDAINKAYLIYHDNQLYEEIFYDETGGYITRKEYTPDKKRSIFTPALKRILGLERGGVVTLLDRDTSNNHLKEKMKVTVAKEPATLSQAIPDQLFVYSNICEPCIVGDAYTPLLRIVNLEADRYKYGSTIVKRFAPVSYMPLLNNRFLTIDIDIRDQYGAPIAFEYGTLTVTLHFKREYS